MTPVKTDRSNFVMRGPTLDIGDIWVEVDKSDGVTYVDWKPTIREREILATKGVIRLGIMQFPMPPVSLEVRPDLIVLDESSPPVPERGA